MDTGGCGSKINQPTAKVFPMGKILSIISDLLFCITMIKEYINA